MCINKDFMDVIRENIPAKYKKHLNTNYDTKIGGGCLIIKNPGDKKDKNPFLFITLYNTIKENKGNEIDFFLYINDKSERDIAVNYILKYNLLNYFKYIKYNYKDEYKKIYDGKKEIGYIVRNTDCSRFEKYINKIYEMKNQQRLENQIKLSNQQQNLQNLGNNPIQQQNISNIPIASNQQQWQNFGNIPNLSNQQQNLINFGNNSSQQQNPTNLNNFPQSGNIKPKKIERYVTSKPQVSNVAIKTDFLLKPVIEYLFLIDELKITLNPNKTLDFQSFTEIIKSSAGPKIKKASNYKIIFDLILTGLDPKVQANKEYYNQTEQFDEEKAHKKFMERHNSEKDSNIIQKLFLIPKEDAIFCKKCKMNSYQFGYEKYIYINNPQSDLLNQILFIPQKEVINGKRCNFCNGETTECSIVKKILGFPQKLIVIIDHNQINNFALQSNLYVQYNNQTIYKLNNFIEANTSTLYKIDDTNNHLCESFINGEFTNPEKVDNKQPIVLFYDLMNNSINANQPNIIQNQQNMNNANVLSQNNNNVFNANSQQNGQQNQIPQNIIPQGIVQNANQINNNQMNFQQNMNNQNNFQQNKNQQNINNQNNFQQNFNQQLSNQNNMQLMNVQNFNQLNNIQNFNGQNQINNINNFQNNGNNNNFQFNMNNTPFNQFNNINNNMQFQMNNMGMNNMNNFNNNNFNNNFQNGMNNNFTNNMLNMNMNTNNNILNNNNVNFNNNNGGLFNNINNMNLFGNNNMNLMGNNNMNLMGINNNNMNIINNNINLNMVPNNTFNNINNNANMINNNCNINSNNMPNNTAMNIAFNNNNFMNNLNNNVQQNFNSNNELPPEKKENTIFVSFTYKRNNKQIFLDINQNETFGNAIIQLDKKYKSSLQNNPNIYFSNKGQIINDFNKTLKQLHIKDSSDITIHD